MAYDGKVMRAALEQFQADKQRRSSQFLERQRRIFRQVPELQRLGADIVVSGRQAEIWGVDCLRGSALTATDLRGGAAMLVAGLAAQGETTVFDDNHITRGYERFDMRLRSLGADIYLEC